MAIAHFTLATCDVDRASRFFEATFGWKPIERPRNAPLPTNWLQIAPGQEIHLVQVADFRPSPFEDEFGRHVALHYPQSGFLELKSRLIEYGAELIAPKRETPFERFFFRSPDGYVFEVISESVNQ